MALADIQQETYEVKMKGGSFVVTALSFNTLSVLIKTHLAEMEEIFDVVAPDLDTDSPINAEALARKLVTEAPGLAANIIALAAGEPDYAGNAARLPFPVQMDTLIEIGRMTFEEVGGIKKTMTMILTMLSETKK